MIEVQNLTKHYGAVTAIRDVSFAVPPGADRRLPRPQRRRQVDDHAHSRLLHAGLQRDGQGGGIRRLPRVDGGAQRIGYLPENVPLYTDMRVAPYLDFVAEVKGVPRGHAQGSAWPR